MARLTIERCKFDHFELVSIAAERAKQLTSGAVPTMPKRDDKYPVLALREIEEDNIDIEQLRDKIISKFQQHVNHDEPEDEGYADAGSDFDDSAEFSATDHDLSGFEGLSIEEFDNDNIFSDDISPEEDK